MFKLDKKVQKWLLIALGVIIAYLILKYLFKDAFSNLKNTLSKATLDITTDFDENDKITAQTLKQKLNSGMYGWTEDEEGIFAIVKSYTKQTYPKLKLAYFELFNSNVSDELRDLLSENEYAEIASIVT